MKFDPEDYRTPRIKLSLGLINPINRQVVVRLQERPDFIQEGRWRAMLKQIETNGDKDTRLGR